MERKSQLKQIIEILERDGLVTRNQCLAIFISRLSARIDDLETLGYVFRPERRAGDYVYYLVKSPAATQLSLV